jgi:ubiquinone biosynthesis accessory factor UbiJ
MTLAADVINRVLEREGWAREKLAAHAGRTLRINVGPASRTVAIAADGRFSHGEAEPDLTLTISPLRLPTLLAQPERWNELVVVEGDAALHATLAELALTLPWFVEEVCARAFGRVAGQQVADIGRRLLALPGYAAERFGESFASYVGEEARLAVGTTEASVFAAEIAALAARVDALAARIDILGGAAPRAPRG